MKTQIASTDPPTMTEIQGYEYQINLKSDDFKMLLQNQIRNFLAGFYRQLIDPLTVIG